MRYDEHLQGNGIFSWTSFFLARNGAFQEQGEAPGSLAEPFPTTFPPPLFINSYFFWSPALSETQHTTSQHKGGGLSFRLEAPVINVLHGNAPTVVCCDFR